MPEGSAFTDGIDSDAEDQELGGEDQDQDSGDSHEEDLETQNADSEDQDNDQGSEDSEDEEGETSKPKDEKKTDKGTNLDKNPLSQANQLRANAEAKVKRYEDILTDPAKLREYRKLAGWDKDEAVNQEKEDELDKVLNFKPENLRTVEDVTEAFSKVKSVIKQLATDNKQLRDGVSSMGEGSRKQTIANNYHTDLGQVRSKYPELDPKSDKYDEELETNIGELFAELDFDSQKREFRGGVSLLALADRIMKAAKKGQKTGSDTAQTHIIDKSKGSVKTGTGKDTSVDESKLTPGQVIASRINKLSKRK